MNYKQTSWGFELVWASTTNYSGKTIIIKEGEQTEFGYCKKTDKTIFVLQGVVNLVLEARTKMLKAGEAYHINPGIMYQLAALKGDATILEAGTSIVDDFIEVKK